MRRLAVPSSVVDPDRKLAATMSADPTAARVQTVAVRAEFRHIIDTLPAFVWCATPDGSIAFLNRRGLEYTGFSLARVTGWYWKDTNINADRLAFIRSS